MSTETIGTIMDGPSWVIYFWLLFQLEQLTVMGGGGGEVYFFDVLLYISMWVTGEMKVELL